jgi:transposase
MIVMDSKRQFKLDVIRKVSEGRLTKFQAAKLLQKSHRMIERYLSAYNREGIIFVVHKNSGRSPANKSCDELRIRVQKLLQSKYFDFNLTHLQEKLQAEENLWVRRETLRKWATDIGLVKKSKKRRNRKRVYRERMPSEGLMVQLDGSPHNWFGGKKTCLIAAVDDATSELFAGFFESETTLGCMSVIKQIIERKGVFHTLYVDRAGIFGGAKRQMFSQLQRACSELGIEIIFAHSPEAKGRIERVFQTLQDRLVAELGLVGITTLGEANDYLQKKFIPNEWSRKFSVKAENTESYYRECKRDLSEIFVIKEYRKVSKDQTVSLRCKGHLVGVNADLSLARHKVEIRTNANGKHSAYFAGKQIKMKKISMPTRPNQSDLDIEQTLKAVRLAERLGNVKKAAREAGVSRQKIYRAKEVIETKGLKYFKNTFAKRIHQNSKLKVLEALVLQFSRKNPHLGEAQVALHLNQQEGISISRGTIRSIWLKNNMQTIALRQRNLQQLATKPNRRKNTT